jgi:hypothetical protein
MITALETTSQTTVRETLLAALIASGVHTTTHYNAGNSLIVTTTRSSKVLKFDFDSTYKRPSTYYGGAWTSGSSITNQVAINNTTINTYANDIRLVVTDKLLLLAVGFITGAITYHLIGNLDNSTSDEIAWGWRSDGSGGYLRHIPSANTMQANMYPLPMTQGGNYLMADLPCLDASGELIATGVKGLKALYRGKVTDTPVQTNGNDAIVAGGGLTSLSSTYFPLSFIIPNGVSWTPR